VGTVHIALAGPSGTKGRSARFVGDRDMIRFQASQSALDMVRVHYLYSSQAVSQMRA
jgi:nicotinamide mononucleotide (NMN) deamidase PncC